MKQIPIFALILCAIALSALSNAADDSRWWYPKYNQSSQERMIPQGQEHFQKQLQEPAQNTLTLPPIVEQYEYMLKEAEATAQKKTNCKDEIIYTINQLFKMSGNPNMDSGAIDVTLASYFPEKCAGVPACDKDGEAIAYTPSPPKLMQTPSPYIYGSMTCKKDVAYNIDGKNYLNYKVSAPLQCNPDLYPSSGAPSTITFIYGEKVPPQVTLCKTTGEEVPFTLTKYFSTTTIETFISKMEALYKSQNKPIPTEYQKSNYGPDGLKMKACMLALPQKNGPDWAAGAKAGNGTTFPANYGIAKMLDGRMVYMQSIQMINATNCPFVNSPKCKTVASIDPDMCEVTITIK